LSFLEETLTSPALSADMPGGEEHSGSVFQRRRSGCILYSQGHCRVRYALDTMKSSLSPRDASLARTKKKGLQALGLQSEIAV